MNLSSISAYTLFTTVSRSEAQCLFSYSPPFVSMQFDQMLWNVMSQSSMHSAISSGIVISSLFLIYQNLFPSDCNASTLVIVTIGKQLFHFRMWDRVDSVSNDFFFVPFVRPTQRWTELYGLKPVTCFVSVVLVGDVPLAMLEMQTNTILNEWFLFAANLFGVHKGRRASRNNKIANRQYSFVVGKKKNIIQHLQGFEKQILFHSFMTVCTKQRAFIQVLWLGYKPKQFASCLKLAFWFIYLFVLFFFLSVWFCCFVVLFL